MNPCQTQGTQIFPINIFQGKPRRHPTLDYGFFSSPIWLPIPIWWNVEYWDDPLVKLQL